MLSGTDLLHISATYHLSATQLVIYLALDAHTSRKGIVQASQRQIAETANVSPNTIKSALAVLARHGLIDDENGTIWVNDPKTVTAVPVVQDGTPDTILSADPKTAIIDAAPSDQQAAADDAELGSSAQIRDALSGSQICDASSFSPDASQIWDSTEFSGQQPEARETAADQVPQDEDDEGDFGRQMAQQHEKRGDGVLEKVAEDRPAGAAQNNHDDPPHAYTHARALKVTIKSNYDRFTQSESEGIPETMNVNDDLHDQSSTFQGHPQESPEDTDLSITSQGSSVEPPIPPTPLPPVDYRPLPAVLTDLFTLQYERGLGHVTLDPPPGYRWDQLLTPTECDTDDAEELNALAATILALGPDHWWARHVLTHAYRAGEDWNKCGGLDPDQDPAILGLWERDYARSTGEVQAREQHFRHPEVRAIQEQCRAEYDRLMARLDRQVVLAAYHRARAQGDRRDLVAYTNWFIMGEQEPPSEPLAALKYQQQLEGRQAILFGE